MRGARPLLLISAFVLFALGVSFWYGRSPEKPARTESESRPTPEPAPHRDPFRARPKPRDPASEIKSKPMQAMQIPAKGGSAVFIAPPAEPQSPFDVYRDVTLSEEVQIGDRKYRVLQGRAFSKENYNSGLGDSLFEHLSSKIVPSSDPAIVGDNWQLLPVKKESKPVLVHATSGMPVLVTGTIIVKTVASADIEAISQAVGVSILHFEPNTQTAYLAAPENAALLTVYSELSQRSDLEHVDLEMANLPLEAK